MDSVLPQGMITRETLSQGDPYVSKSLEKADKLMKQLQLTLKQTNRQPRIIAIILHLMIEYYVNEILIVRRVLKKHNEKKSWNDKMELLSQQPEIDNKLKKSLKILEEIRNAYAHQIEVSETFVKNKLNQVYKLHSKNWLNPFPETLQKQMDLVYRFIETDIKMKYCEVLVRYRMSKSKK